MLLDFYLEQQKHVLFKFVYFFTNTDQHLINIQNTFYTEMLIDSELTRNVNNYKYKNIMKSFIYLVISYFTMQVLPKNQTEKLCTINFFEHFKTVLILCFIVSKYKPCMFNASVCVDSYLHIINLPSKHLTAK